MRSPQDGIKRVVDVGGLNFLFALYLSEVFTTHIDGLGTMESAGLPTFRVRHATRPEFQCRFRWRPDSVAMWDNRASMHYAVADYWPEHRLMHRLSIEKDALERVT